MKLIVDLSIICDGKRAFFRKEFETDLQMPMVGMQFEDPAFKDPHPIKNVIINPAEGYYRVSVGDDTRLEKNELNQLEKMYLGHGWTRQTSQQGLERIYPSLRKKR
jgi:hypothetical protein